MPSSFDPNALVKAMGQQTDPFSWAQMYSQDASKQSMLMEQLKARMLQQEELLAERAKERGLDRANASEIALNNRSAAFERLKYKLANTAAKGGSSKEFDLPPGAMSEKEFGIAKMRGTADPKKFTIKVLGGKPYYIPATGAASVTPPIATKKSTYEDDDDDE